MEKVPLLRCESVGRTAQRNCHGLCNTHQPENAGTRRERGLEAKVRKGKLAVRHAEKLGFISPTALFFPIFLYNFNQSR